jgi:AcrR family transcriptional regulator
MATPEHSTRAALQATDAPAASLRQGSSRYALKKQAIVAAASAILNREGLKGMTFADVAASVGLITTSVTYYFRRKEDLALACLLDSIDRLERLLDLALAEPTVERRIHRLLDVYLERHRRIRMGEETPPAVLSEIRALEGPHREQMRDAFRSLLLRAGKLFDEDPTVTLSAVERDARTHMVMEQLFWSMTWLPRYDVEDYPRLRDRMHDILLRGIAADACSWNPLPLRIDACAGSSDASAATFLLAATRLINMQGYRGASVEKISAELHVTKGSFYHHNENKDELVVACFRRSFDVMRQAQRAAIALSASYWDRLSSAAAALVTFQLSEYGPLLRASALGALPQQIRLEMMAGSDRVSERFAALISDGVAEGSIRPVDATIAAQMLNATLNASADLVWWLPDVPPQAAPALYVKPMLMGIAS